MAPAAFENLMTRGFCNSHCLSQLAAFFLDMGTKISTVENFFFFIFLSFWFLLETEISSKKNNWRE